MASGCSVYIGNLPYSATEDDVGNFFQGCGNVVNVRLVYDRETNRLKGFGFCEFADQQSAANAVNQLNGADFNGRPLRVSYSNN